MGTKAAYREVLAVADARALIGASAVSQLGDWLYNAVLLGYVYAATGSAAWVGAATIGRLVPYVLLGPLGGVVADRYDRRTVLLVGDLVRMGCMGLLAATVAVDAPVVLVIGITALASAAGTAERPAAMALLPRLVGEGRLGAANALLHTVQDLGVVLGPALGAVLLVLGPAEGAFVANAVTFAVSASLLATIGHRSKPVAERAGDGTLDQLRYGLRTARATPFVLPLFIVVAMAELTYGAQTVQLVLYSERRLDLGPEGYGYLLAAAGVGGLLSATVNHRLAASTRVSGIVVGAGALFCATQVAYAGVDSLPAALLVTVLGGVGIVACEVVAETTLARVAPHDVLGRVMGVYDAISVAAMVAGAVLAPVIVDATSLRVSLLVLGLASLAITALCLGALRGVDALSRRRAEGLAAQVSLLESLPIAAGLPRSVIERLASAAQVCPLPAGVDVVIEGAPAHAFYAVVDGGAVVHQAGEELARLGPGGHFGELGLLDGVPRSATVTTVGPSTLLRLEGDVFLEALQSAPTLLSALQRPSPSRTTRGEATAIVDDAEWVGA